METHIMLNSLFHLPADMDDYTLLAIAFGTITGLLAMAYKAATTPLS